MPTLPTLPAGLQKEAEKRAAMQRKGHGACLACRCGSWAAGMPAYLPLMASAPACRTCLDQAVLLATMLDVWLCLMLDQFLAGTYEEVAEGDFLEVSATASR